MTKHLDPTHAMISAVLAELQSLRREVAELRQAAPQLAIGKFPGTLASSIHSTLSHLNEPVFANPRTGLQASSVFAVVRALGWNYKGGWARVWGLAGEWPNEDALFERRDLQKRGQWPTLCIDLEEAEAFLLKLQPRAAKRAIAEFRKEHGIV